MINNSKNDHRLVFFTPIDDSKILDVAKSVGAILFVTISACAQLDCLDYTKLPRPELLGAPTGKEESVEFESDFI